MKINNNFSIKISYFSDGKLCTENLSDNSQTKNIRYRLETDNYRLKLMIIPDGRISMQSAEISFDYIYFKTSRIFVNGYQSWTDSREFSPDEKMKSLNRVPSFIVKKYAFDSYGDYSFKKYSDKKGIFHGYSYSYVRNADTFNFFGSLSEATGYTVFNFNALTSKVIIEKDCTGFEADREFCLFDLCFLSGDEKYVFDRYFELMNVKPLRTKAMSGYTSWYNHYQNISESVITKNLNAIADFTPKPDIFQIDDGYQTAVGDWLSVDRHKFPGGLKPVSENIKSKGLIPGLWLAPFVCESTSRIYNEHKDWILKDNTGKFVTAGSNWSGFYTLDIYNQEVRSYIRKCFKTILDDWGFELVKLDFLYAVSIIPYNGKSRGQIMCEAMDFLRECVGDKLILGCGVPLAPAFGKVDFCRIGCDIGLDFDDNFIMRRFHRERVSTKNAIYNTIYRRQLDNRAFLNDPDVFLLRDNNIKLTEKQKENLCTINSLFGSLLFTSDDINDYDINKKKTFRKAFAYLNCKADKVSEIKKGLFEVKYTDGKSHKKLLINIYKK